MSGAAFTPGPWSVEDPMDFELSIVEANKPTHEWRFIAGCGLPDGDDDQAFTGREIHANARLIATAPELYGLLHELASAVATTAMPAEAVNRLEPLIGKSIALLAKARGDQ